jgi:cation:H+ antiporter
MVQSVVFLIVGIILLVKGADLFVDHATILGKSLRLPQVLIGILVVAVGTSLPELAVSAIASMQGNPEIAVGNIIGSNITNIGLIVGISAILGTVTLTRRTVDFDIPISILPIGVLVFGYILNMTVAKYIGVLLLVTYLGYLMFSAREYANKIEGGHAPIKISVKNALWLIGGLVVLIVGAEITLNYAEQIAKLFGLSDIFVGSIILALGTSLPELVTTVTAVLKKRGELALGNVLGSNVFNLLAALGVSAIIHPIAIDTFVYEIVFLGLISLAFLLVAKTGKKYAITRLEGVVLLLVYFAYVYVMFTVVS